MHVDIQMNPCALQDSSGIEHKGVLVRKPGSLQVEILSDLVVGVEELLVSPDQIVRSNQAEDRMLQALQHVYDPDSIVRAVNSRIGSSTSIRDEGLEIFVPTAIAENKPGKKRGAERAATIRPPKNMRSSMLGGLPPPPLAPLPAKLPVPASAASAAGDGDVASRLLTYPHCSQDLQSTLLALRGATQSHESLANKF